MVGAGERRESETVTFRVVKSLAGERLSRAVAAGVPGLSVRGAKELADLGRVFVDGRRVLMSSRLLREGELVEVHLDRFAIPPAISPEDLLWVGTGVAALNKPPGLLVEGAAGIVEGSVIPQLERVLRESGQWRSGDQLRLVHRLDRDTSGLLLVACHEPAARSLEEQFRAHQVEKRYLALVMGTPARESLRACSPVRARRHPGDRDARVSAGKVNGLGRPSGGFAGGERGAVTPRDTGTGRRLRQAHPASSGRGEGRKTSRGGGGRAAGTQEAGLDQPGPQAVTEFRLLESFESCSLVEARPAGGRTHQIRIHLAKLGHPVLGDLLYGPRKLAEPFLRAIPRQMLHAASLAFVDPDTGQRLRLEAPTAPDMLGILNLLRDPG